MPIYQYKCTHCNANIDIAQNMQNYKPEIKCPQCRHNSLQRIFSTGYGFVKLSDTEIKTVGHLAHRNSEKMSEDEKRALHKKHYAYKYKKPEKDLPQGMRRINRKIP